MNKAVLILLTCVMFVTLLLAAATPPALVNYQGVLRDGTGAPHAGSFDMTFRFYNLVTAGTLLLTDTHNAAAPSGQVIVSNGLFTAQLGAGTLTAGSEPNLAEVFRDNAAVWLEIQIYNPETPGWETLSPRVRVIASAYAQNAATLQGAVNVSGTGNVGIGTATPGYKLDVDGNMKLIGAFHDSSGDAGTNGQVLSSMGSATNWIDPPVVSDGDWTISGNDIYSAVSGNVGIGASAPNAKLHVSASDAPEIRVENTTYAVGQTAALKFMHNTRYAGLESYLPGNNDVDLRFITTDSSAPLVAMTITGDARVGVGTSTPTGRFEVAQHIGTLDAYSDSFNNYACIQANLWQSFTAGRTGFLVHLSCRVAASDSKTGIVQIYEGEGVSGTLLATGNIDIPAFAQMGFRNVVFSDPPAVSAGSQYTFRITAPSPFYLYGDPTDPYPGGRISCDAGADGQFLTYVGSGTKEASLFVDPLTGSTGLGTSAPSNRLHVVGTASISENLGIGTNTPVYRLDVNGDARVTGAFRDTSGDPGTSGQLLSSTAAGTNWISPSTLSDSDWTISGNNMYSAVSGNVGIGTTTPGYKLDVDGNMKLVGAFHDSSGDAGSSGQILSSTAAGTNWISPSTLSDGDWTISGSNMYSAVSGNVGIGTTAPAYNLEVSSTGTPVLAVQTRAVGGQDAVLRIMGSRDASTTDNIASIQLHNDNAAGTPFEGARIALRNSDSNISTSNADLVFLTNNGSTLTEKMRIKDNGHVGIGTNAPAAELHVLGSGWFGLDSGSLGSAAGQGIRVWTEASTNMGRIYAYDYAAAAPLNLSLQQPGGNVGIGSITPAFQLQLSTDSAAKPSGGNWTNPSDLRLKKNIRPFADGLEVIEKINPVRYQYNGLAGLPNDMEGIGVVAQDAQKAAPYTVGTFKAKLNTRDAEETELYDFNGSALTFVMINAIKELDERTKGLEGKDGAKSGARSLNMEPNSPDGKRALKTAGAAAGTEASPTGTYGPAVQMLPGVTGIEPGDVLVLNPANGDELYPCNLPADPMVVGIALEESETSLSPLTSHWWWWAG